MGASKMPKGMDCPPQISETVLIDYDNFDIEKVNALPDFIQEKIFSSMEFNALMGEAEEEKRQAQAEVEGDEPF